MIRGLPNLGNSCYINCILQCLYSCNEITKYILDTKFIQIPCKNNLLVCHTKQNFFKFYKKFLEEYNDSEKNLYDSLSNLRNITHQNFNNTDPQDAHEFLVYLLDKLDECLRIENPTFTKALHNFYNIPKNHPKEERIYFSQRQWYIFLKKNYSIITENFYGLYKNSIICRGCLTKEEKFEPFLILTLPIQNKDNTILNCITKFQHAILIKDRKCDHCKDTKDAIQYTKIWKLPKILIIHFNRFCNENIMNVSKNNNPIHLPISHTFIEYNYKGVVYDLYGFVEHYGNINQGHYVSTIKNSNNEWINLNDLFISKIDITKFPTNHLYILFYKRR